MTTPETSQKRWIEWVNLFINFFKKEGHFCNFTKTSHLLHIDRPITEHDKILNTIVDLNINLSESSKTAYENLWTHIEEKSSNNSFQQLDKNLEFLRQELEITREELVKIPHIDTNLELSTDKIINQLKLESQELDIRREDTLEQIIKTKQQVELATQQVASITLLIESVKTEFKLQLENIKNQNSQNQKVLIETRQILENSQEREIKANKLIIEVKEILEFLKLQQYG